MSFIETLWSPAHKKGGDLRKPGPASVPLTGRERFFANDAIIVTKTDVGGRITYANRTFLDISALTERQALGAPHSLIRHPDMPRSIFRLLWQTIQGGREIFAFVINRAMTGDHYWVMAHVTPSIDADGKIIGFHSNRRVPDRHALERVIQPLYRQILTAERAHGDGPASIAAGVDVLTRVLDARSESYDEFIFTL
jgi:PAS domain S-box-containing protein